MKNLVEVYCLVDNLVKIISSKMKKTLAGYPGNLSITDYVVLALIKHQSVIQSNKHLYHMAQNVYMNCFSTFPSYQQFNNGIKSTFKYFIIITWMLMHRICLQKNKYYFVDSTPLAVCKNPYRFKAKLFRYLPSSSNNVCGWFWGFKLHLIINENMEIESMRITTGYSSDRSVLDEKFIRHITGILVGDKGYIGKEKSDFLATRKLVLIIKVRKNMKQLPAPKGINYLLSKRQAIESVFSKIKYRLNAVNSLARSAKGFFCRHFCTNSCLFY